MGIVRVVDSTITQKIRDDMSERELKMSNETTIRDVVIKVSFEQATSSPLMSAFETVQAQADSAQKAIVEVTKAIQQFQTTAAGATTGNVSNANLIGLNPFEAGLRVPDFSRSFTNDPAHGAAANHISMKNTFEVSSSQGNSGLSQLADATKQLNWLKSAALGAAEAKQTLRNASDGLTPQLGKLATIVRSGATAVENATMAIGGMAQSAMAAGQTFSGRGDQLHKGLEKPTEQSRVRESGFGVASKPAVEPFGLSKKWMPERVFNAVGVTTTIDENEDSFLRQHAERKDPANARRSVTKGIVRRSQEELNTNQLILALNQQKDGVTVSEQREARAIAEKGRESLAEKMLKFGSADQATKASLREIQHKADQGVELNHLKTQRAESYGIGPSRQAHQQSLDAAMRPENAKLFPHDIELQNRRGQDASDAEAQPVKHEQDELTNQIGRLSDDMKQGTNRLIAALEQAFKVDDLIDSISTQIEAQVTELQRLRVRVNRNWF